MVESMRPMSRSGKSSITAATMSAKGATSGAKGWRRAGRMPRRCFQAGVATPSR